MLEISVQNFTTKTTFSHTIPRLVMRSASIVGRWRGLSHMPTEEEVGAMFPLVPPDPV